MKINSQNNQDECDFNSPYPSFLMQAFPAIALIATSQKVELS